MCRDDIEIQAAPDFKRLSHRNRQNILIKSGAKEMVVIEMTTNFAMKEALDRYSNQSFRCPAVQYR